MKPNQLDILVDPVTGRTWAVKRAFNKPIQRIRDITDDVLLALCADLSADKETNQVERTVSFTDGMVCEIIVKMIERGNPVFEKEVA